MELLGDRGNVESHFSRFADSVSAVQDMCTVCAKCVIDLDIILDTPDDTPK
jgi:hypothetical protein